MAINKKKTTTAIVAGVTAVALLLGGTFAWTSISQRALNEAAGVVNVGGRLHDDFNGTNKDIYVENFTDPLNGGQPIYARIRLDEYMEVGSEAGKYDADSDSYVADRNAKPVVEGTDIADVSTWTTHVPTESCTVCATSESCAIHDHWTWTMGNTVAKYFMPTFNKDKDSLKADINGTYHGKNDTDKIYYDDYVVYEKDQTKEDVAYYDDDTDTEENDHASGAGVRQETETHTAKLTGTATVMTMQQWLDEGSKPGNFWVYDTDGWAYWANPIMPGESTGFLLDGIEMTKNPGEKCYYAINVVAQFATVGDWENFYTDPDSKDYDVSEKAQELLEKAAAAVPVVTVTNVSGATTVEQGKSYDFTATVTTGATANASITAGDFEWTVYDENMVESETSTVAANDNGGVTLTVGASEQSKALILAARCTDAKYLGATGLTSMAVNVKTLPVYRIAVSMLNDELGDYSDIGSLVAGNSYTIAMMKDNEVMPIHSIKIEGVTGSEQFKDTGFELTKESTLTEDENAETYTLSIDQDEVTDGSYDNFYKIIKISIKTSADQEEAYTRSFVIDSSGCYINAIAFRDPEGMYMGTRELQTNTVYTMEAEIFCQNASMAFNDYLDPVLLDGYTFSVDQSNSDPVEGVQIENNTILFPSAGEFVVKAQKDEHTLETYIRVNAPDTTAPTIAFVDNVQTHAKVTISGLNDADFPLTLTAYAQTGVSENNEAVFADVAYSTFNITLTDGTPAFSKENIVNMADNLPSYNAESGTLTFTYYAGADGLNDYDDGNNKIGLKLVVSDVAGNKSDYTLSWFYSDGCFVAGTQVQTVDGPVAIETIKVGDEVYSMDLTTGEKVVQPVTWVQEDIYVNAVYTIYAGGEEITVTAKHPVYVIGKEWVTVENLSVGDKLLDMNGNTVEISNIVYTELDAPVQVYNFTVDGTHNYLVGENGILVHNKL